MKNIAIELEGSRQVIKWMEWRITKLEALEARIRNIERMLAIICHNSPDPNLEQKYISIYEQ